MLQRVSRYTRGILILVRQLQLHVMPFQRWQAIFPSFTNDEYEPIHATRNRRIYKAFSIVVILHWVYLFVVSYTLTRSIDWVLLFGLQLPGYLALALASFIHWKWTPISRALWYTLISYVGCILPACVNYKTYSCLKGTLDGGSCEDSSRPAYLNNLLYSTIGPLIVITVFRNALMYQIANNAAILSTLLLQVKYSPRVTWLNTALLVGAYAFFFILRFNQNQTEYNTYRSSINLQAQVDEGALQRTHDIEASRTRDMLTNYIFHEIRVPLNTVVLSVDLLEDSFSLKGHLSGDEDNTFEQLKSGLMAVQTVVNDALDIRRLEEGRLHMDMKPFDFGVFIENIVWVSSSSWERKGIHFEHSMDERLRSVLLVGDSSRLKQIISNLINNAVKFTPSGGSVNLKVAALNVTTSAVRLRISLKDSGIGIALQDQSKLFQHFVQIDANKNQQGKGSGLGLSICAHLVKMQGGSIGVMSDISKGAEFWFELSFPTYTKDDTLDERIDTPQSSSAHKAVATKRDDRSLRILVTDDDENTRNLLQKVLVRMGHRVDLAQDGVECLERVDAMRQSKVMYDGFFMDNMMPRMTGMEAINHLRADGVSEPIVCLTGSTSPLEEAELQKAGATGVLLKPVKLRDIERIIETLFPVIQIDT